VHPEDRELLRATVRSALDAGGDYRVELRFGRPEGVTRWSLVAGRVLIDDRGSPARMAGIDLDITSRKGVEAMLREADRRKDEFLAILAHELRNPLAPITNAVQILKAKNPGTPEVSWASQVIERQTRQMTRLVDDLLDVSRISRGKLELRKQRTTLDAVIRAALETSRPFLESHGQRLEVSLPAEPVELDADGTRLAQSVMNLLNNSAKYTDSDGTIRLTATREGNQAVISVADTGIGIPPEMLDRVFDMFIQIDHTLERSHGGLGVGLALVRTIVEMHGGTVRCRSDGPGRGSEFVIRLPVSARVAEPSAAPQRRRRDENRSHRILVAEDGHDAADSFGALLSIMGHEVRVVYDGETAVRTAEEFQPNVIIMDLGMPRLNGYDAARSIRQTTWGARVTLIALSGWGQLEDRVRSAEAGFDRHLTKPVDPAVIEAVLDSPTSP
jgi:signal transduction histidine kinase/CheY-like chemotaxis protein